MSLSYVLSTYIAYLQFLFNFIAIAVFLFSFSRFLILESSILHQKNSFCERRKERKYDHVEETGLQSWCFSTDLKGLCKKIKRYTEINIVPMVTICTT